MNFMVCSVPILVEGMETDEMNTQDVTLPLPEALYLRLKQTAQATRQSLTKERVTQSPSP